MMNGASSCYPNGQQVMPTYALPDQEGVMPCSSMDATSNSSHPTSFHYNLSVLKDKVHQVQSLAAIFLSPDNGQPHESTAIAIPTMGTLIQEIIVTASSMMFTCQQMSLGSASTPSFDPQHHHRPNKPPGPASTAATGFFSDHTVVDHWSYEDGYNRCDSNNNNNHEDENSHQNRRNCSVMPRKTETSEGFITESLSSSSGKKYDIIELAAADLLAKYTHYCHVCGKGFKRDANLRMHMRAHGDEYKSSAALSNPMKNVNAAGEAAAAAAAGRPKYSCPQEGCRWNKNHAKFQPLKSMICVKNHYKRSHCPKMYVCKRCNRKQFSVLSDLRTHEKHCGDLKWLCSCGTTFSRKDKLMGHVALFVGHVPAATASSKANAAQHSAVQMQLQH